MRKIWLVLIVLVASMFLFSACQGETVEVTRVVTETVSEQVEVTRIVEGEAVTEFVEVTRVVEVAVEAEPAEPEPEPAEEGPFEVVMG